MSEWLFVEASMVLDQSRSGCRGLLPSGSTQLRWGLPSFCLVGIVVGEAVGMGSRVLSWSLVLGVGCPFLGLLGLGVADVGEVGIPSGILQ